jgi:hypothetical protein
VPNRHFRHFPADLRPRCSRSAAIGCINPSDGGPRVRIHLPPAVSLQTFGPAPLIARYSSWARNGPASQTGPPEFTTPDVRGGTGGRRRDVARAEGRLYGIGLAAQHEPAS